MAVAGSPWIVVEGGGDERRAYGDMNFARDGDERGTSLVVENLDAALDQFRVILENLEENLRSPNQH
jgi:hypothetical protein